MKYSILHDFLNKEFLIFLLAFKFIIVFFVYIFNVPLLITNNEIVNKYTRYHFTLFITIESILNFIYIFLTQYISNIMNLKSMYQKLILLITITISFSSLFYIYFQFISSNTGSFYNDWYRSLGNNVYILTILFTTTIFLTYHYILNEVNEYL